MRSLTYLEASHYPPAIADLLRDLPLAPLGPGQPATHVAGRLGALGESSFAPLRVVDRRMAAACRAGLYLAYDFLDESHKISQDVETPEGSFWHAIMHRREPDASNSAYWFRRVGNHPIFATLATEARALGLRLGDEHWNPFDFIDQCEERRGTNTDQELLLRRVQQKEWQLLFAWCFRHATGGA